MTKKYKSLKLNRTKLKLKQEANFLRLIMDRKLSWKSNIFNRIKNASIALYACNSMLERKCGLKTWDDSLDLPSYGPTYLDLLMLNMVRLP